MSCPQRPEAGIRCSGVGITGSCESTYTGVGKWTPSFAGAACTLNHGALSPVPKILLPKNMFSYSNVCMLQMKRGKCKLDVFLIMNSKIYYCICALSYQLCRKTTW